MKKILLMLTIVASTILTTGCLKRDTLEDVTIYTTVYPIEYITNRLYGEHSEIYSIYPYGVDPTNYELTDKQIKDYSVAKLFIFNGLNEEKNYVGKLSKYNRNLKIIDATYSVDHTSITDTSNNQVVDNNEEVWLDPSNFLWIAQNIKNGFNEYISNHYLKNEIKENYEELKLEISNLDAELSEMYENRTRGTIVVSDDVFKFLEKYGFKVISLEENDKLTEKTIEDVKSLIKTSQTTHIFVKKNEEVSKTIVSLKKNTDVKLLELNTLANISEEERNNNEDYISIMTENLELLKQEIYE